MAAPYALPGRLAIHHLVMTMSTFGDIGDQIISEHFNPRRFCNTLLIYTTLPYHRQGFHWSLHAIPLAQFVGDSRRLAHVQRDYAITTFPDGPRIHNSWLLPSRNFNSNSPMRQEQIRYGKAKLHSVIVADSCHYSVVGCEGARLWNKWPCRSLAIYRCVIGPKIHPSQAETIQQALSQPLLPTQISS